MNNTKEKQRLNKEYGMIYADTDSVISRGNMKRSIKRIAFLDRFYKKFCCGAKNHPSSWKKEKRINQKVTRRRLKVDLRVESED